MHGKDSAGRNKMTDVPLFLLGRSIVTRIAMLARRGLRACKAVLAASA